MLFLALLAFIGTVVGVCMMSAVDNKYISKAPLSTNRTLRDELLNELKHVNHDSQLKRRMKGADVYHNKT